MNFTKNTEMWSGFRPTSFHIERPNPGRIITVVDQDIYSSQKMKISIGIHQEVSIVSLLHLTNNISSIDACSPMRFPSAHYANKSLS